MKYTSSGARFSSDRTHRFYLWRIWDEAKPNVMWLCLNPSTANETESDNTMESIERISRSNGFGGFYIVNCFSFISTDPKGIETNEMVEMVNKRMVLEVSLQSSDVVFAWGACKLVKSSGISTYFQKTFPMAKCLSKNKDGSPKHPLYCKSDSKLIYFN